MDRENKKSSPNFTNVERENLLALVAKLQGAIECNRYDRGILLVKKEGRVDYSNNSLCTARPRNEE